MSTSNNLVCLSTSKPSSAVTATGGGGSLTLMCPQTGSIVSSIRLHADMSGKSPLGVISISPFPQGFSKSNTHLVMAYGRNSTKKTDTYGMLLSLRFGSSSPILHWKCRLPEADLTGGLLVSKCGQYAVGGGASGSCFVWSTIGGNLLKTFKAHYREVRCLSWSVCGRYLVSGGADGMVHSFLLIDLVDLSTRNSKRSTTPAHTWSSHQFPVTSLVTLDGARVASASEDGQVVVMELFSKVTLATLQLPSGIACLTQNNGRLYAGSSSGSIFSIDLNAYAMYQTEKHGAALTKRQRHDRQKQQALLEKVFGRPSCDENAALRLFQSEWIGHDSSVTSIAFLMERGEERLVSGDDLGHIRIWDVESRTCLHVVKPWSHGGSDKPKDNLATKIAKSPVTSICIAPQPAESSSTSMFDSAPSGKSQSTIATMISPLQKYPQDEEMTSVKIPFLRPNRSAKNMQYWTARTIERKRKTDSSGESSMKLSAAQATIAQLQKKLLDKQDEVERWEQVNNKLLAKLKAKS